MNQNFARLLVAFFLLSAMVGCATPYNYANFRRHKPKSILILPPLNNSTDVRGTYSYLSTVTMPVAEKGYYVFPVAMIDELMKQNGLPTPHDMHQVSLKKIGEIIDPDAVLYLTLEQYGTKFMVIDSQTTVQVYGKLVDVRSGKLLWEGRATGTDAGNNSSGGLVGSLVGAVVEQAINSTIDRAHEVSAVTNNQLFNTEGQGLLNGPYHPNQGQ